MASSRPPAARPAARSSSRRQPPPASPIWPRCTKPPLEMRQPNGAIPQTVMSPAWAAEADAGDGSASRRLIIDRAHPSAAFEIRRDIPRHVEPTHPSRCGPRHGRRGPDRLHHDAHRRTGRPGVSAAGAALLRSHHGRALSRSRPCAPVSCPPQYWRQQVPEPDRRGAGHGRGRSEPNSTSIGRKPAARRCATASASAGRASAGRATRASPSSASGRPGRRRPR